jgi:hypothetical protein
MSGLNRCDRCGAFVWNGAHSCEAFKVWLGYVGAEPDLDDVPMTVWGADAESVAESVARVDNEGGDYWMVSGGGGSALLVVENAIGERVKLRVSAEPAIDYSTEVVP